MKSATVAPWLASAKAPSKTVPVVVPSTPVISVPFEPVSLASMTVAVPGGQRGDHTAAGRDDDVDRERRLFGVGVVAQDLEDRFAVAASTPIW